MVDLYCSPQGFKKPKRTMENLLSIQNIVIDLDSHSTDMTIPELQKYIKSFTPKLLKYIPIKPNFVHQTGRGLQLWWCIEPCHVSLGYYVKNCVEALLSMVDDALCYADDIVLELDKTASKRITGYYRVPYTYNTKTNTWSTGKLYHKKRPHVADLHKSLCNAGYACYEHMPKEIKEKYKNSSKPVKIIKKVPKVPGTCIQTPYTPCFIYRKRALDHLVSEHGITEGHRHGFLLAYYTVYSNLYGDDMADDYIRSLNEILVPAFSDEHLEYLISSYHKKRYKYKEAKFFELVGYDKPVLPHYITKKEAAKKKVKDRKAIRDAQIYEMYAQGHTITHISKVLSVSRPTIYKVLAA